MLNHQANSFLLKTIQAHERCWGTETYKNRPSLQDILNAKIVAIWYPTRKFSRKCFTISIHTEISEVEAYMSKIVIAYGKQSPDKRLRSLFVDQKQVKIMGVSLILDSMTE